METIKTLYFKLHRVEKYLGLPLSPSGLKEEELVKKLKDIRKEYNVII